MLLDLECHQLIRPLIELYDLFPDLSEEKMLTNLLCYVLLMVDWEMIRSLLGPKGFVDKGMEEENILLLKVREFKRQTMRSGDKYIRIQMRELKEGEEEPEEEKIQRETHNLFIDLSVLYDERDFWLRDRIPSQSVFEMFDSLQLDFSKHDIEVKKFR